MDDFLLSNCFTSGFINSVDEGSEARDTIDGIEGNSHTSISDVLKLHVGSDLLRLWKDNCFAVEGWITVVDSVGSSDLSNDGVATSKTEIINEGLEVE